MKSIEKNLSKGITLIALVVTIVILIILATISIRAVVRRKWVDYENRTSKDYEKNSRFTGNVKYGKT